MNIIGSADKFMAYAALDMWKEGIQAGFKVHPGFLEECEKWSAKAIPKNGFGYVSGKIIHFFHGERENRGYVSRWELMEKHQFNPATDLQYNKHGVIELLPHQKALQDDIRGYFTRRKDDAKSNVMQKMPSYGKSSGPPGTKTSTSNYVPYVPPNPHPYPDPYPPHP